MLGLAAGDAVGTTLEFKPPGSFAPIHDMVGGGPFRLAPGEWTDDTSMALCPAESLLEVVAADRWRQPGLHPEVAAVAAGSWATRGLVEAEWARRLSRAGGVGRAACELVDRDLTTDESARFGTTGTDPPHCGESVSGVLSTRGVGRRGDSLEVSVG